MYQVFGEVKPSKMKCCVPNCEDKYSSRFRFPRAKNMDMVQLWLKKINNPMLNNVSYEDLYSKYRVCARHFQKDFIKDGSKGRGVTYDAVPVLYLPESERLEEPEPAKKQKLEEPVMEKSSETTLPISIIYDKGQYCMPSTSAIRIETEDFAAEIIDKDTVHSSHPTIGLSSLCSQTEVHPPSLDSHNSPRAQKISSPITVKVFHGHQKNILKEVGVTRQKFLTPKAKHLYKKVLESSNKLGRLSKKVSSFRSRLAAAEQLALSPKFEGLITHVNPLTYQFILSQVRTQHQKPKARRFTLDEKLLALTILKASGKGYRLLSKIFALPSKQTLTNVLNRIPFKPGINKHMFDTMERTVQKMKPLDRFGVLLFDEMSIESLLTYDSKEDEIKGIEDFGEDKRKAELADHVNVFMVKGLFRQWKQPVCYTFSGGPMKSQSLKVLLKDVVRECHRIGLRILATVCDQGGPNQAAIKQLLSETRDSCLKDGTENKYFGFLIDGEEVIPLFDTPHLFKGLRNNLLTKDLHFQMEGKGHVAKWNHIEQFYFLDIEDQDVRVCPKLTDQHVIRGKISKMKVRCCMQVFSHQVGALMKKIIAWDSQVNLDRDAVDTADLILFLDKLFDSLNSSKKYNPPGKPLKSAVTSDSDHISFWYKAISIIETMKFYCSKKNKFTIVPSIKNLIYTLKGFIYLSQKILKLNKNKYILTRVIQQDALENFFGCIRGYSGRENVPSASHFVTSFKALITNNFMSRHSPGANCEEDANEGPLNNLKEFVTGDSLLGIDYLEPPVVVIPAVVLVPGRSKIARCTINYIAGFIFKKILKKITCEVCRRNMSFRDQILDLDFIQARQYDKKCNLTVPGTFLSFLVSQSISRLFFLIPRLCHMKNVGFILKDILSRQLQFTLINCSEHTSNHKILLNLLIKCCLFFWCKRVNLVSKGKDEKFIKFLKLKPNKILIDPVKLAAYKRYQSKIKRSKAYQKKSYEDLDL